MSAISRTVAWCKLAVLIADGAPAPVAVRFDEAGPMVEVETAEEVSAWAEASGLALREPYTGSTGITSHKAYGAWQGLDVIVSAYVKPKPAPEPVTEDMTKVREIAGTVSE
jgi:hypothetical protein